MPSAEPQAGTRSAMLAQLFELAGRAAGAGDLSASKALHEAIGKLLGVEAGAASGPIVDLAVERERRRPG